ncbi:MAG: biotin--[acetyl-CoA-carboxylase] ligase [Candidatus Thermoplasmatota archaeon]|nr:biotin--[acetyl-CoA-carboxylase] ligase [Candidatus Thermoplasmatota archaeon]
MSETSFVEQTKTFFQELDVPMVQKPLVFDSLSSTNAKAKELAQQGAQEGTVILSRTQEQGRGRFDRTWTSPEGGIYFSIILRPTCKPEQATLLTFVGALAVWKTIDDFCDLAPSIKWPNDVRIRDKKVSGVLLESESDSAGMKYVVLGIGINLNMDIDVLSKSFHATSLSYELGINLDYYRFLKEVLTNLHSYYAHFTLGDHAWLLQEWKLHSDTFGKKVRVESSAKTIEGIASDVDESGFLLVTTKTGEVKKVTSGDCIYFG